MASNFIVHTSNSNVRVSTTLLSDSNIFTIAKGAYAVLASLGPNWHATIPGFAVILDLSEDTTRKIMKNLESNGYLTRHSISSEDGAGRGGWLWELFPEPVPFSMRTRAGKSNVSFGKTGTLAEMHSEQCSGKTGTLAETHSEQCSGKTGTLAEMHSEQCSGNVPSHDSANTETGKEKIIKKKDLLKIIFNGCAKKKINLSCVNDIYKYLNNHPDADINITIAKWIDNYDRPFDLEGHYHSYLMSLLFDKYGLEVIEHRPRVLSLAANNITIEFDDTSSANWFRQRLDEILMYFKTNIVFDNPEKGQLIIK